jgi:hypothetical protein
MRWNRRVVDMTAENGGEPLFAIREVFHTRRSAIGHGEPSVSQTPWHGYGVGCIGEMQRCTKASQC